MAIKNNINIEITAECDFCGSSAIFTNRTEWRKHFRHQPVVGLTGEVFCKHTNCRRRYKAWRGNTKPQIEEAQRYGSMQTDKS